MISARRSVQARSHCSAGLALSCTNSCAWVDSTWRGTRNAVLIFAQVDKQMRRPDEPDAGCARWVVTRMSMRRSLQIGGYDLAIRSAATSTSDDDDATISMATACRKNTSLLRHCASSQERLGQRGPLPGAGSDTASLLRDLSGKQHTGRTRLSRPRWMPTSLWTPLAYDSKWSPGGSRLRNVGALNQALQRSVFGRSSCSRRLLRHPVHTTHYTLPVG
jgi:hypothetical protein